MLITIFTPTYNRAHLLPKLFESLCRQTYREFEWVIVDDGSKDGTGDLVNSQFSHNSQLYASSSASQSRFPVRYFYQENGGKHRAINRGVKEAQGELFLIVDSDDTLPERALERIDYYYQQVRDDARFGGVCGYMAHHDGTIIGRGCDIPVFDTNSIDLRYKYHIQGDMLEVFRTPVLREIPFPDIEGEKFVPEALVWNRIACKYQLRVFHEMVYYRDYLDGGLTDKIVKIRMNSPIASMMCYQELNGYDVPLSQKLKAAINYWRFRLCSKGHKRIPHLPWWWNWVMPLGWLMHLNDKRKV